MSPTPFLIFFTISIVFLLSNAKNTPTKPSGFYIPIKKDPKSHLYYTDVVIGSPALSKGLVIDLGGRTSWINCDTYVSSSYRPIMCLSAECKSLNTNFCAQCDGPPRKNCSNVITCGTDTFNPVLGIYVRPKELGYDTIQVYSTGYLSLYDVTHFIFSCSDSSLSEELPKNTTGVLGLGRTKASLSTQLADKFGLPNKFALCIPSSSKKGYGDLFIGGGPYYMPPHKEDFSKSLTKTHLIVNRHQDGIPLISDPHDVFEYFIDLKSIRVEGKLVTFNTSLLSIEGEAGGTKISTVDRYTILHTSIYEAVTNAYVQAASSRNITRISSVKPFGACFSSNSIASSKTGPNVPTIDLVFETSEVYWRIYGANSMVRLNEDAMCLGFVDGGITDAYSPSIVLGGNLLEDNLIELDLDSSMLGFTSSLSLYDTSCSHIRV